MEAKFAGDRVIENMTKALREYEDKSGKRAPEREELIAELQRIIGAFVGATYLLQHTRKLVNELHERQDLSETERQEVDYLRENLNL